MQDEALMTPQRNSQLISKGSAGTRGDILYIDVSYIPSAGTGATQLSILADSKMAGKIAVIAHCP